MINEKNKIKLNLGCGQTRPSGWINTDSSLNSLAQKNIFIQMILKKFTRTTIYESATAKYMNLNKRWKYSDESVSTVYASHVLEHLSTEKAGHFMAESYRVLLSGGVIRIVVPDFYQITKNYVDNFEHGEEHDIDSTLTQCNLHKSKAYAPDRNVLKKFIDFIQDYPHQHKYMYDSKNLLKIFENNSFKKCIFKTYGKSDYIQEIDDVECTAEGVPSIYLEAIKID